ncbi:MAG: DEAD/DEAH box helicase, partial [Bacteroidetes bacterium]|nr:DEAD/DEAH box helicase [Bacteroidota bacterium]
MNKFEEFGLNSAVLKAIGDMGFENPTPVQEQTIPILLEGQTDLVALAQTGTGKTAAFGLPLLQLLDFTKRTPQALILCPTRELCMQITRDINTFATHMNGVSITAVYGGASIMNQLRDIKRGVQIIVATPGRLIDIISRKRIDLSGIKYLVLD